MEVLVVHKIIVPVSHGSFSLILNLPTVSLQITLNWSFNTGHGTVPTPRPIRPNIRHTVVTPSPFRIELSEGYLHLSGWEFSSIVDYLSMVDVANAFFYMSELWRHRDGSLFSL